MIISIQDTLNRISIALSNKGVYLDQYEAIAQVDHYEIVCTLTDGKEFTVTSNMTYNEVHSVVFLACNAMPFTAKAFTSFCKGA